MPLITKCGGCRAIAVRQVPIGSRHTAISLAAQPISTGRFAVRSMAASTSARSPSQPRSRIVSTNASAATSALPRCRVLNTSSVMEPHSTRHAAWRTSRGLVNLRQHGVIGSAVPHETTQRGLEATGFACDTGRSYAPSRARGRSPLSTRPDPPSTSHTADAEKAHVPSRRWFRRQRRAHCAEVWPIA